ncbi:MAG: ketoacyl-ACP synthase III [Burkholderiales bacterium]|jgi:3-oxoacyl-[acyl-carrier-protein] synthase-3|nr:ketoacyl-ACP synthase III [Burkholderiales bacterium]
MSSTERVFSRIVGVGSALPERCVTNAMLAAELGERGIETSDEWIMARTGISQRYIASPEVTSSVLGARAARAALAYCGMAPESIDLIIVATSTPDYVFPSTACLVQRDLGIAGCPAFDVQAVCSGFVYALSVADALITNGSSKNALVIGAEVFSRILDWSDRGTCVLFGDGAGAVVLSASDRPGILASKLHADGRHEGLLRTAGNVSHGAIVGTPFLTMDGQAVFKLAVSMLDQVGRETVAAAGMTVADIDWLVPHQANIRILQATGRKLGIPAERVVVTVDRHANTSAASVPLALDTAVRDGRIREGHRVMLQGVGGGFTWGSVFVQF